MQPLTHPMVLTEFDRNRLTGLLRLLRRRLAVDAWSLDVLERELRHARVVANRDIPADVITMNSRVCLRELTSGERWLATLVFPNAHADDPGAVPVLSPLGLALLGCRAGKVLEWDTACGKRRLLVETVAYQPEAAGHFHL